MADLIRLDELRARAAKHGKPITNGGVMQTKATWDEVLALVEAVEAAQAEVARLAVAPQGKFPTEDRLRAALARFVAPGEEHPE